MIKMIMRTAARGRSTIRNQQAATQNAHYGIVIGAACEQEPTCIVTRVIQSRMM